VSSGGDIGFGSKPIFARLSRMSADLRISFTPLLSLVTMSAGRSARPRMP
jgi:hypothetical protein